MDTIGSLVLVGIAHGSWSVDDHARKVAERNGVEHVKSRELLTVNDPRRVCYLQGFKQKLADAMEEFISIYGAHSCWISEKAAA